jgi:hypothetical protein
LADRIEFDGDHIQVLNSANELIWRDDIRPINLLPDAFTINATLDIQMPNMTTSFSHIASLVNSFGNDIVACTCWGIIKADLEWGPAEGSPYTLADQVIGTVPTGVNFLDVRVNLVRTLAPASYLNVTVDNLLPEEETFLPGGSMRLEDTPSWRRTALIALDGTDVKLSRWQSVGDYGVGAVTGDNRLGSGYGWYSPASGGDWTVVSLQSQQTPHIWANPSTSSKYSDGHCPPGTIPTWGARWEGPAVIRPGYKVP